MSKPGRNGEHFRQKYQHPAIGIALMDWQGVFQECNPACCALLGYSEEELRRVNLASLIQAEEREARLVEMHRLQDGEIPSFETENCILLPTATRMQSESTDGTDRRDMFSVAGLPARYNNYMLDGVGNNDNAINMAAIKPSMDSVAEYRILTGTYSAEYGRGGGAQINVVTKSGSNEFHGTAYEFYRNSAMDAKNFFDKPARRFCQMFFAQVERSYMRRLRGRPTRYVS